MTTKPDNLIALHHQMTGSYVVDASPLVQQPLDKWAVRLILSQKEQIEQLETDREKFRQEVEALQGIQPEMPPMPPNGEGLPRYGVRWGGPTQPLSVPKDDGYWTPWHLAQAECAQLRAAIRRLCNIYVVDDYYMGQLREERLEDAVRRAIDATLANQGKDGEA